MVFRYNLLPRSSVSKRIRYNILYLQSQDMERLKHIFMPSTGSERTEFSETIICSGECQTVNVQKYIEYIIFSHIYYII